MRFDKKRNIIIAAAIALISSRVYTHTEAREEPVQQCFLELIKSIEES